MILSAFFLSEVLNIQALLKKFKMNDCKSVVSPLLTNEKLQEDDASPSPESDASNYRSLIGSLIYHNTTRSNIMYVTSLL